MCQNKDFYIEIFFLTKIYVKRKKNFLATHKLCQFKDFYIVIFILTTTEIFDLREMCQNKDFYIEIFF